MASSSASTINASAVLRQFDDLVKQGELFYSPAKPECLVDEGFEFEFRLSSSFKLKPQLSSTTADGTLATAQSASRPPPTDGSDIDHSDPAFFVCTFQGTHKLILNKFCLFRPQHLLLTLDPLRRQDEPLETADYLAVWEALVVLDGKGSGEEGKGVKHYAVYNGGKEAGSSRRHKHMQVLAQPRAEDGDLELVGYNAEQVAKIPCVAFFAALGEEFRGQDVGEVGRKVARIAEEQYRLAQRALGVEEKEGNNIPYNVMLTTDWIITVPRRKGTLDEGRLKAHVVGCQGVLGAAWASNLEQIQAWKEVGPANVLRELGVPKGR